MRGHRPNICQADRDSLEDVGLPRVDDRIDPGDHRALRQFFAATAFDEHRTADKATVASSRDRITDQANQRESSKIRQEALQQAHLTAADIVGEWEGNL